LGRRVVVTGVGLICGVGNNAEEVWQALLAGKSGIERITSFDVSAFACQIGAEVKNFDPLQYIEKKEARKMARFIHLAIAAADEALKSANYKVENEQMAERTGVDIGSGIGGFDIIEREHSNLINGGPRKISPFFIPSAIVNLAAGQVSMRHNAKGPNEATCTACTTSAHSIGDAARIIKYGDADVMIAGGSEAAITPMGVGGFAAMRALSTRNDDPHASRPWDKDRDGFVIGEGAGIVILEELEHAKQRGARILAEVIGYGMSADAYHITQPAEDGDGGFRVMRNALRDAGIAPEQVGYVNAHGTSTPLGDEIEATAIKRAFGEHAYKMVVSSTKSMTGHLLGGAGGLEAGITVLALRDQVVPPTMNLENPGEGCDLDFAPNAARKVSMEYAMSNSFGFGGTNGCLVFKRWAE